MLAQAGRKVRHYHADNGLFAHNGFLDSINQKDQKIIFCAVLAHHQNLIVENKNKMLTLTGRTLLLIGIRHWPEIIDSMFWPFAMKAAAERHNTLSINAQNETPSYLLHDVKVKSIPVKSFHTLFCSVYILDARARSDGGTGPPNWGRPSRIEGAS